MLTYNLIGSIDDTGVREGEIPNWVRALFESEPNVTYARLLVELDPDDEPEEIIVRRGKPKAAMIRAGLDTSYMNPDLLQKAADAANEITERHKVEDSPETAVNALGDFIMALLYEVAEFSEPSVGAQEGVLGFLETLTEQVKGMT